MKVTTSIVTFMAVLVLSVFACSNSSNRSNPEDAPIEKYVADFNSVGRGLEAEGTKLRDIMAGAQEIGDNAGVDIPVPREYAVRLRDFLRSAADGLDGLDPPDGVRAAHKELVASLRDNARVWERYTNLLTGSDSIEELVAAGSAVQVESEVAADRFAAACEALTEQLDGRSLGELVC